MRIVEQCLNGELDARVSSIATSMKLSISEVDTSNIPASIDMAESELSTISSRPPSTSIDPLPASASDETLSTDSSPITDGTTSTEPTTTGPVSDSSESASAEPSSTESVDSSSFETTTSTEPTTSSDDSDTTTGADTATSVDTTSSIDTATSAGITDSTETSAETTTSVETTTDLDSTTSIESTTTAETTTSIEATTTAETTSSIDTIPSAEVTTTSAEVATTTETTTGLETTSDAPATTTSAGEQLTVLFSDDGPASQHRDDSRVAHSPFDIYMHGRRSTMLTISISGDIRLGISDTDPSRGPLPSESEEPAVFGYWSESSIVRNSGQGITYGVFFQAPRRRFHIDFKVFPDSNMDDSEPDHYTVTFFEDVQDYCKVQYFHTHGTGEDATIGNQDDVSILGTSNYNEYSYNVKGKIPDGTVLIMDITGGGGFTLER